MQAHRAVGHRLYRLGRYEEAVAAFRRAYEVKADARLLFDIAECYREMGAVDQALFYYDRYLAGWPDAFDRAEVDEKVAELEAMRGGTAPRTAVAARRRHPLMIVESPPSKPRQAPRVVAALVVLDGGRRRRAGRHRRGRRIVVRIGDVGAGDGPRQQEVLLKRALGLLALLAVAPACHHDQNAVLLIVVTASGTPPTVASLDVTLTLTPGRIAPSMNHYAHEGPDPIMFPTTLSAELPGYATGDVQHRGARRRCQRHDGRHRSRRDHDPSRRAPDGLRAPRLRRRRLHRRRRDWKCRRRHARNQRALRQRARRSGRDVRHRDRAGRSRRVPALVRRPHRLHARQPRRQRLHRELQPRADRGSSAVRRLLPGRRPSRRRQSRQRLLADVRQRGRRQGRDVRHGDPAGHARRLPAHGRLPGRDVRQGCHHLERHLLGCMHLEAIPCRRARTSDSCCPPGATHDTRHRLPDSVWQRGGRDARRGLRRRESHRARRAPARRPATTATHAPSTTS